MKKLLSGLDYRKLWLLFGIGLIVGPISAQASGIVTCTGLTCTLQDLFRMLITIYNMLLGMAALVAMLFIIYGAAQMLYWSFMENSATELENAKYTVRRAIGGFAIIVLAYTIVNTAIVMLGNEGGIKDVLNGLF